jgi:hypothetical protein
MRNLLALDASDFASPEAAGANFRGHARRLATPPRESAPYFRRRRSGAAASEMATMIVVLVAWALIAGYMFGHAAEGLLAAAPAAGAVSTASQASPETSAALA